VLSNHDVIRHASRFGGDYGRATASDGISAKDPQPNIELGLAKARGATLFTLALPGSMYLYQGEELGLPEHSTLEDQYRQDPTFFRTEGKRVGRDGARVPLPWEANASASNGFSPSGAAWLPQPASYADYSRDKQTGVKGSTLEMYREALELRKELSLGSGSFEWVKEFCGETSLGFLNQGILVIHNFGTDSLPLPECELIATSSPASQAIEPNQTVWLRLK